MSLSQTLNQFAQNLGRYHSTAITSFITYTTDYSITYIDTPIHPPPTLRLEAGESLARKVK